MLLVPKRETIIFISSLNVGVKLRGESTWSASGNLRSKFMGYCREHLRANRGLKELFKLENELKAFEGI